MMLVSAPLPDPMFDAAQPLVRLECVSRHFYGAAPTRALDGVTMTIERGESVAVVGRSGSGKSSLLNVLGLLDRPDSGEYFLAGKETSLLTDGQRSAWRAGRIGFVFQSFHLMPRRSVLDNVQLALMYARAPREERIARATAALFRVGLGRKLNAMPTQLSGGEQQRVSIARALVARPSILLCDEPTGNLDSQTSEGVLRLLRELVDDGVTLVVVTHDPGVARFMRRVISMRDGRLENDPELDGFWRTNADRPC